MSRDRWAPGTRAVHAGLPEPEPGAPFLPGPVFAGPFHLPGDPEAAEYGYGRIGNPTWTNYEAALGELEGGDAVAFASGMAAVTAVLYALGEGGPIVVPDDGYFMTRRAAARLGAATGMEVRLTPIDTAAAVKATAGARLVIVD